MAESLHYIQGVGLVEELTAELLMVGVEVDMVQNQLLLGLSGSGPLLRIHSCAQWTVSKDNLTCYQWTTVHGKIGSARDGQENQESKQPDSLHSDITYLTFVSYTYS